LQLAHKQQEQQHM